MIDLIFGSDSAQKILLHVFHYQQIHASGIANDYGIALTPIKNQLEKFERAGVLVSVQYGRTRNYMFNEKSPYSKHVIEIIRVAYESIPLEDRELIFGARRRPRRAGKPL